jgi:hypothetical protein
MDSSPRSMRQYRMVFNVAQIASLCTALLLTAHVAAWSATTYSFELREVAFPESGGTTFSGMADNGYIAGWYFDRQGLQRSTQSKPLSRILTRVEVPWLIQTQAHDVNSAGVIVGSFNDKFGQQGFAYQGGAMHIIDLPFCYWQEAFGVNDANQSVGVCYHTDEVPSLTGASGFLAAFNQTLDTVILEWIRVPEPGTWETVAYAISNTGVVVGKYHNYTITGYARGFMYNTVSHAYTYPIVAPDCQGHTWLEDVNDAGHFVAMCLEDDGPMTAYHYNGTWNVLSVPNMVRTWVRGMTSTGRLVGTAMDADGREFGFIGRVLTP